MSTSPADGTDARRDALAVGLLREGSPGLVAAYRFGSSAAGAERSDSAERAMYLSYAAQFAAGHQTGDKQRVQRAGGALQGEIVRPRQQFTASRALLPRCAAAR